MYNRNGIARREGKGRNGRREVRKEVRKKGSRIEGGKKGRIQGR